MQIITNNEWNKRIAGLSRIVNYDLPFFADSLAERHPDNAEIITAVTSGIPPCVMAHKYMVGETVYFNPHTQACT